MNTLHKNSSLCKGNSPFLDVFGIHDIAKCYSGNLVIAFDDEPTLIHRDSSTKEVIWEIGLLLAVEFLKVKMV